LSEKEECVILNDRSGQGLAWYGRDSVHTTFILRWMYYGPRAKLCFVEGSHKTLEEANSVINKSRTGVRPQGYAEDWPIHYEVTCYPEDLICLAKKILEVFASEEN
jgi:hypothetical protein